MIMILLAVNILFAVGVMALLAHRLHAYMIANKRCKYLSELDSTDTIKLVINDTRRTYVAFYNCALKSFVSLIALVMVNSLIYFCLQISFIK